MKKETENLLSKLNDNYTNLMEIMKVETDIKTLKELEKDINKINGVIKVLRQFNNYQILKELKSKS